jgi:hypothetical protein
MSASTYAALTAECEIIGKVHDEAKVLLLPDQSVVKLFRITRGFSSALFYPYSIRFARNARRLRRLGIRSVQVERVFCCPSIARHGVVYRMLPGQALLHMNIDADLRARLAGFVAGLHEKGVYFRSLHLGNILLQPDGGFALIDVADTRFKRKPLAPARRMRNFRHLVRVPAHRSKFLELGWDEFLAEYLDATDLSARQRAKLQSGLATLATTMKQGT